MRASATTRGIRRRALPAVLIMLGGAAVAPAAAGAQRPKFYEQTYLPASHNWAFRRAHPEADGLFNAFDYGHAIIGEAYVARPAGADAELEGRRFDFITRRLLVHPPALALDETAIAPRYARLVPEVVAMFEWAHMLHRQTYDIWADARIPEHAKDAAVAEVLRYYRSRPDLAFSDRPKSMTLMEGQPYSLAFRRRAPKMNGLIWSYHWLQMAVYDALLAGDTPAARAAGVRATVARFRALLDDAPASMPRVMPMSPTVAPAFSARYPEVAIIFDNLHAMHDVVSDILASERVPHARRRAEMLRAAAWYRDSTTAVITVAEWREHAAAMER